MNPIKAVIIDDEPVAIEVLQELARLLARDLEIVATAADGISALRVISHTRPDLLFLDIDMPYLNGMELVEKLQPRPPAVIFTTGSSGYALKALKLEAVDYLLKPIDPSDFALAVEKARNKLAARPAATPPSGIQRLQLPTQQGIFYLAESDILHITGKGSYSQIQTSDKNDTITVSKNIGQLEKMLSAQFFRCHNSHIINLRYVKSFYSKDGYWVLLKDGSSIEVSRRSKDRLLQKLAGQ